MRTCRERSGWGKNSSSKSFHRYPLNNTLKYSALCLKLCLHSSGFWFHKSANKKTQTKQNKPQTHSKCMEGICLCSLPHPVNVLLCARERLFQRWQGEPVWTGELCPLQLALCCPHRPQTRRAEENWIETDHAVVKPGSLFLSPSNTSHYNYQLNGRKLPGAPCIFSQVHLSPPVASV